jgi:hypothetical protein
LSIHSSLLSFLIASNLVHHVQNLCILDLLLLHLISLVSCLLPHLISLLSYEGRDIKGCGTGDTDRQPWWWGAGAPTGSTAPCKMKFLGFGVET